MYILGINGGFRQGYQDISAVLLKDGKIIYGIEEERLSRIKFSAGKLPYLSILEILKQERISINDINIIAFHGSTWNGDFKLQLHKYFNHHFGYCPEIRQYHHHDCHAASTFYASNFTEALIFTYDGSGDGISLQVSIGENHQINSVYRAERPHSLGIFYSLITQYCGFVKDSDEYKLMGLSSYGNRKAFDFSWLLSVKQGELNINEKYLTKIQQGQPSPHRDEMLFNEEFEKKLGKKRRIPSSKMEEFYKDIAASAQQHLENCLLDIMNYYVKKYSIKNICLAGGVALNCVANQKIMNAEWVDNIFIQPASSDAGISLGAAWLASNEKSIKPQKSQNTYLGTSFSNEDIEHILKLCKIKYSLIENPSLIAAKLIHDNKVVGWFQGRMEFGPRALGYRSILANPTNPKMQQIVNEKIKFRESFRPFCPSVLEEDFDLYFIGKQKVSPYMTITYQATEFATNNIPSVIHIDNTARIQTVNEQQNKRFYHLLKELKILNGHGVVLNTSFNLSHEPIVHSPHDALASFFSSGLDALIMGNFIILK